jgi:hypothetical protein
MQHSLLNVVSYAASKAYLPTNIDAFIIYECKHSCNAAFIDAMLTAFL